MNVECQICDNSFSHDTRESEPRTPIVGKCGHCFCRECVRNMHLAEVEESSRKVVNLKCPECRERTFRADDMTPNFLFCSILAPSSSSSGVSHGSSANSGCPAAASAGARRSDDAAVRRSDGTPRATEETGTSSTRDSPEKTYKSASNRTKASPPEATTRRKRKARASATTNPADLQSGYFQSERSSSISCESDKGNDNVDVRSVESNEESVRDAGSSCKKNTVNTSQGTSEAETSCTSGASGTPVSTSENEQVDAEVEVVEDNDNASTLCPLSRIKVELFNKSRAVRVSPTLADRERRSRLRLASNKTPQNRPRKVFRRGCHPRCLTQVLGGSPISPVPHVKNIPALSPDGGNPFIKAGEFYFAGRSDWNPWTPAFSGDVGFLPSYLGMEEQEAFHTFLHCSSKAWEPHYHGKKAAGKRLYLGRYRVVPEDDTIEVQETGRLFMFSSLGSDSQFTMAEHDRKFNCESRGVDNDGNEQVASQENLKREHFARAETCAEAEQEGSWSAMPQDKQEIYAWIQMLLSINYKLHILPVEFVDYDEALYEKLVETGADSGEVAIDNKNLGPL